MSLRTLPLVASLGGLIATLSAQDSLIEPGLRLAVIDTAHIHALVPADQALLVRPLVLRAEELYVQLAQEAGYQISRRLNLFLSDSVDSHNGYSFVTPYPLINVQLAPATPASTIFTGDPAFERTFIHEATHHITNDRSYGFRFCLENIFGRILPNDFLSLFVAYLSTPSHQTMPAFWHEGLAQWAETHYAKPGSAWGGRGRDSLTHMVWRLDTAAGGIPPPGDWHLTHQAWPFGSETYIYGLAYTRHLFRTFDKQPSLWRISDQQAHAWAFNFDRAPRHLLGNRHGYFIAEARRALEQEQQANIAIIRRQPVTQAKRLTPNHCKIGAPCWTPDGRLFAAIDDPCGHPRFAYVDAKGTIDGTWSNAFALGAARSLPDGTIVYHEIPEANTTYTTSRVYLNRHALDGRRLMQPDVRQAADPTRPGHTRPQVVSVHLKPGGDQELLDDGGSGGVPIPTQGRPWTPTFRPNSGQLAWVETDNSGSRLILAPLADSTQRTALAQVRGRILHPAWSADGKYIFICADHSGVPNAYRIDADKPGILVPVTNTLGGVIACVPSFDGKELAIIDHDHHGPFLARIANEESTWPKEVPAIDLAWPDDRDERLAFGVRRSAFDSHEESKVSSLPMINGNMTDRGSSDDPTPNAERRTPNALPPIRPYHGLTEIRPLFWTPTTLPVPEGGWGVAGVAMDPVQTHQIIASLGVGPVEHSPVGLAAWAYSGWHLDLAALAWQSERTYFEQLITADNLVRDYSENRTSGEARLGYGLTGTARRWQAWLAGGVSYQREVPAAADRYDGIPVVSIRPFQGHERYVEATLAYDSSMLFPTSFAREDGANLALSYRRSGYGGEFTGERLLAKGGYVLSVIPSWGQQLVTGGVVGWSDSDTHVQGQFHSGGNNAYGLPRGYPSYMASGPYLLGGTVAWRTPLWQPFHGFGTTPFVFRQAVLELFYEGAKVSFDHVHGDGLWVRSTGGELRWSFVFWEALINPGLGFAKQIDGKQEGAAYFTMDFLW